MHIWLDGTYGVGKTSVARKIQEKLTKEKAEILDSDEVYKNFNPEDRKVFALPQCDEEFIRYFRSKIEERMKYSNKDIIVTMALTSNISKTMLADYFAKAMEHIILTASKDTIEQRIENDKDRDKKTAMDHLDWNIKFLGESYKEAIRVDTDNKTIDEEVEEIIKLLKIQ